MRRRAPDTTAVRRRRRHTVGLLGGSFNPAHDGHLYVSRQALCRLGLQEVWWLVSPQNPLKPKSGMADFNQRLMRARRFAADRRIKVKGIERTLGTRYTVDTLTALGSRFQNHRFVWLIGADNLVQLPRWQRWTRIFHLVPIAVFARKPYDFKALNGQAACRFARFRRPGKAAGRLAWQRPPAWVFLAMRRHPASATAIRMRAPKGPDLSA